MVPLSISRQADDGQKAARAKGSLDWNAWLHSDPLAESSMSSIMLGDVHQWIKGAVNLNDRKLLA